MKQKLQVLGGNGNISFYEFAIVITTLLLARNKEFYQGQLHGCTTCAVTLGPVLGLINALQSSS